MIAIDNVLISDEVVQEQFVCNLDKCKGACCVVGDCGAPVTDEEIQIIELVYPVIKSTLPLNSIPEIEKQGLFVTDKEHGKVTPTIDGGVCVYGIHSAGGMVKCAFEKAYEEGKISFKKPLSCHLFPIRIKAFDGYEAMNYQPAEEICDSGCAFGKKLKVPVYQFLKEPIIRKYGKDFYHALDTIAQKMM